MLDRPTNDRGPRQLGGSRRILITTPEQVSVARRAVVDVLADAPDDMIDAARLIASELATNGYRYGEEDGQPPFLSVRRANTSVLIEVWSPGQAVELAAGEPSETEENGRGLLLVEELSTRWGTRPSPPDGLTVWAELSWAAAGTRE